MGFWGGYTPIHLVTGKNGGLDKGRIGIKMRIKPSKAVLAVATFRAYRLGLTNGYVFNKRYA